MLLIISPIIFSTLMISGSCTSSTAPSSSPLSRLSPSEQYANNKYPPSDQYLYEYRIGNFDKGEKGIEIEGMTNDQHNQSNVEIKYYLDGTNLYPTQFVFNNNGFESLINNENIDNDNEKSTATIITPSDGERMSIFDGKLPTLDDYIFNGDIDNQQEYIHQRQIEPFESIKYLDNNVNSSETNNQIDYSSSIISEEDSYLSKNSGSFGKRIQGTNENNFKKSFMFNHYIFPFQANNSTNLVDQSENANVKITKSNFKNKFNYFQDIKKGAAFHNPVENFTNEKEKNLKVILSDVIIESPESRVENITNNTVSEKKTSTVNFNKNGNFFDPIVVINESNEDNYQENSENYNDNVKSSSTLDILNEHSVVSNSGSLYNVNHTLAVTPKVLNQDRITTSSALLLNPIQAGVALLNAGRSNLISEDVEPVLSSDKSSKFYENPPMDSSKLTELTVKQDDDPKRISFDEKIIPTVSELDKSNNTSVSTSSSLINDQTVEIQKSLEIYHSMPVHEIHYPVQLTSQGIDQNEEVYIDKIKHENSEQVLTLNGNTHKLPSNIGNNNHGSTLKFQSNYDLSTSQESQSRPIDLLFRKKNEKKNDERSENIKESTEEKNIKMFGREGIDDKIVSSNIQTPRGIYLELERLPNTFPINQHYGTNEKPIRHEDSIREAQSLSNIRDPSNPVQRLEVNRLNNHDEHQRQLQSSTNELRIKPEFNYPRAEINFTQQQIPIFTAENSFLGNKLQQSSTKIYRNNNKQFRKPQQDQINNQSEKGSYNKYLKIHGIPKVLNYSDDKFIKSIQAYPISVDEIVEKHVSNLQPYSIELEKIREKMLPYPIQKLPYPIHILSTYPVGKIVKEPVHIPIIFNKVQISQQYPLEIPLKVGFNGNIDQKSHLMPHDVPYIQEESNLTDLKLPINTSVQSYRSYRYNIPVIAINQDRSLSKRYSLLSEFGKQLQQQSLSPLVTDKRPFLNQLSLLTHPDAVDQPTTFQWHVTHRRGPEKQINKNIDYVGPVPLLQHALNLHQQNQVVFPAHQQSPHHSSGVSSSLRRIRLPETDYSAKTSNFRQSKMEYGFKPPMVPSIQYDEQTSSKVK